MMKKKVTTLVAASLAALTLLAGCGSNGTADTWILFFASSTLALVPYPLFEAYSGFMDPDVLDFYDQPVIRLLPAVTCGVNLCVSAGCSMVLVGKRSKR